MQGGQQQPQHQEQQLVGLSPQEWEELKRMTVQKLYFSGWMDTVQGKCREVYNERVAEGQNGSTSNHLSHSELLAQVHDGAATSVPDHVKADVLRSIKLALLDKIKQENDD
jgi:hypothetical protein